MAGYGRGILRGATGGMGNLAASIMRGPQTEQGAYDAESLQQSRIAQALANIRQSNAAADKDAAETDLIGNRPNLYREQAALGAGIDLPTLDAFGRKLAGMPTEVPMGPPTADGDMGVGSAQFSPELSSKIAQALQRNVPLIASGGAIKADDWAKALGMFGDQDLRDRMISGQQAPLPVALAERAMKGGDAYSFNEYGVGNQFTGAVDTSNPAAMRFGDKRVAETGKETALAGQAKAGAVENYAQARKADADAAKARADAADGTNRGGMKAPAGYRWGADGKTLEAIPGGPADPNTKGAKLSKPPTEGQAKSLMFATRMAAADEIIGELERNGTKMPSMMKRAAEAVPLVGTGLGMAANAFTTSAEQEYEQAQADFINAILRKESGAVISDQEFARAVKQYFPEPNDDAQKLRQKAANRKTAISGLKAEFGEAFLPEFDKIVQESRKSRAKPRDGGASGSWDDPNSGWSFQRVDK